MPENEEDKVGFSSGGRRIDKSCAGEKPQTPRPLPRSNLTPAGLTSHLDAIRHAINQNTSALRVLTRLLTRRTNPDDLSA